MFMRSKRPVVWGALSQARPVIARDPDDPVWAWAPYVPDEKRPWTLSLAGHLHRRAGFGATWDELQQTLADGPRKSVDRLFAACDEDEAGAFNRTYDQFEAGAAKADSIEELQAWWLRRMILSPCPLLEKMTLFWHGHFATSNSGVGDTGLMQRHIALLRHHALGNFADFTRGIARDPAVLLWLDAGNNRKARPAEGFARALFETFTLGPGNFAPGDIAEAARAFTGRLVRGKRLCDVPREHDPGIKRVLGREGPFTGDDVVDLVVEQRATGRTVVLGLYRWLISEVEDPADALIDPLIEEFANHHDLKRLVETMIRSNLFYSHVAYRRRIKSPVEFAVGIVRLLGGLVSTVHLARDIARLGQDLCRPPTVKGWAGERYWITGTTMVRRYSLASRLLGDGKPYGGRLDPWGTARSQGFTDIEPAARFALDLFVQGDLESKAATALLDSIPIAARETDAATMLRGLVHSVVTLPEYQLA